MNPHAAAPTSPASLLRSLARHHGLLLQLTRRDIAARYKGSMAGLLWSWAHPLIALLVYTFVFSVVFRSRWGAGGEESTTQFAMVLFAGLLVHGFFAEVLNRSPALVTQNVSYVKRVVFPLEVLPVAAGLASLFQAGINCVVLVLGLWLFNGTLHPAALLAPLVLLPLLLMALGLAWFLAAAAVFIRDIAQFTGIACGLLMFLSPVFYPSSAVAPAYRPLLQLSPLTWPIEQLRELTVWGRLPGLAPWLAYWALSLLLAWLGYAFFQKTRKGFADVL